MAQTIPPSLDDRIQALCQELQDMILHFTLAFTPEDLVVQVNQSTKAPWQLQINRATRKKLAPVYFGTTAFQVAMHLSYATTASWLKVQTPIHRSMITCLQHDLEGELWVSHGYYSLVSQATSSVQLAKAVVARLNLSLKEFDAELERGALQVNYPMVDDKGNLQMIWVSSSTDWDSLNRR